MNNRAKQLGAAERQRCRRTVPPQTNVLFISSVYTRPHYLLLLLTQLLLITQLLSHAQAIG